MGQIPRSTERILVCNANATLCAGCPDTVTITMPDGPPYTAGDMLTCTSDGYPAPTYAWTVDGGPGSSTSTQVLEEGEHQYVCTATDTFDDEVTCANDAILTITAYSKYQKECNTVATVLALTALSEANWCDSGA